jgi:23S rRNA (adenine2030-N6)-methyltransferase
VNYRHGFHAGNFADVLKHAILVLLIEGLREKPQPFTVMDSHAGAGRYDLAGEAARTGEFRHGILRVLDRNDAPPSLQPYLRLVQAANDGGPLQAYPGSPLLARLLLRPGDRLILNELEPAAQASLKTLFRNDSQVALHRRDGYEAVGALLPPQPRRGVLMIDPPFEKTDEFARLGTAAITAAKRWPEGRVVLWYPTKDRSAATAFEQALAAASLTGWVAELRVAGGAEGLGSCALALINPPWQFESVLRSLLPWLTVNLARDRQAGWDLREFGRKSVSDG